VPMEDVFCQEKDVMELTTVEIIPMKPTAVCLYFTVGLLVIARLQQLLWYAVKRYNHFRIFDRWNGSSKTGDAIMQFITSG